VILEAVSNLAWGKWYAMSSGRVISSPAEGSTHVVGSVIGGLVPVGVDTLDPRAEIGTESIVGRSRCNVNAIVDTFISSQTTIIRMLAHASTDSIISYRSA